MRKKVQTFSIFLFDFFVQFYTFSDDINSWLGTSLENMLLLKNILMIQGGENPGAKRASLFYIILFLLTYGNFRK